MAEVLVLVEATRELGVKKVTLELLTLARDAGRAVARWCSAAPGAAAALADKLGEYGAEKIYAAEGDEIDGYLVAPKADRAGRAGQAGAAGRRAARRPPRRARRSPAGSRSSSTTACSPTWSS